MDLADTYIMFVRQNQDILRDKVNEEMYIEKILDVSSCLREECLHLLRAAPSITIAKVSDALGALIMSCPRMPRSEAELIKRC